MMNWKDVKWSCYILSYFQSVCLEQQREIIKTISQNIQYLGQVSKYEPKVITAHSAQNWRYNNLIMIAKDEGHRCCSKEAQLVKMRQKLSLL
jgi:hypothetical protein